MSSRPVRALAVLALLVVSTAPLSAQCPGYAFAGVIPTTIANAGARPVAVSGDRAVVGFGTVGGLGGASVLQLGPGGWSIEAELAAVPGVSFGRRVDIDGEVIVVNGYLGSAVYVFRFDGVDWVYEQEITAFDGQIGNDFGVEVALSGDVIVVGAYSADGPVPDAGAVYVYRYDGVSWVGEQKLFASDASSSSVFGAEVDVDGDVIVVGSPQYPIANDPNGRAYIYRHVGGTWVEEAALSSAIPCTGFCSERLGEAVAVEGNRVAIGAPSYQAVLPTGTFLGAGAVFIHEYDGLSWSFSAQVLPANMSSGGTYAIGESIELLGDTLITGAPRYGLNGITSAGGIFRFRKFGSDWTQVELVTDETPEFLEGFGRRVASNGEWLLGSHGGSTTLPETVIYDRSGCTIQFVRGDCNTDGLVDIADAVHTLAVLFQGAGPASCPEACESNSDGGFDIADAITLLNYLFASGAPPLSRGGRAGGVRVSTASTLLVLEKADLAVGERNWPQPPRSRSRPAGGPQRSCGPSHAGAGAHRVGGEPLVVLRGPPRLLSCPPREVPPGAPVGAPLPPAMLAAPPPAHPVACRHGSTRRPGTISKCLQ